MGTAVPAGSIIMPNNYNIESIFANAITTDVTDSKFGFYMIARKK